MLVIGYGSDLEISADTIHVEDIIGLHEFPPALARRLGDYDLHLMPQADTGDGLLRCVITAEPHEGRRYTARDIGRVRRAGAKAVDRRIFVPERSQKLERELSRVKTAQARGRIRLLRSLRDS